MNHLSEADVQAIRALSDVHRTGLVSHDPDVYLSACTNDITFVPPGGNIVSGRDAARLYLEEFPHMTDMQVQVEEVEGSGDLAFSRGTATATMQDGTRGVFKWLAIHRRTDGGWKMSRDIWNMEGNASE